MRDVDTVNFLPGQPARAARAGRPKIPPKRPFGTFINKGKSRLLKANKGKKNKKLMKVNEAAKKSKVAVDRGVRPNAMGQIGRSRLYLAKISAERIWLFSNLPGD
jgi:hypothetical protein